MTQEQQLVIDLAKSGHNVLVDACIGSGKTTTIQHLCDQLDSSILYLTYNTLLKYDAKSKIRNSNVLVQNYHGYAAYCLSKLGKHVSPSDQIQTFIKLKPQSSFDVLILDEYQDIDTEISEMLEIIKHQNPGIQIIAVGDMCQKIYDRTSLDVVFFIEQFLGEYKQVYFTKCFRINQSHADFLGTIWKKDIHGVNDKCLTGELTFQQTLTFLSQQDPSNVLCLGMRTGSMSSMLNILEKDYPSKYNKNTTYATIRDRGDAFGDKSFISQLSKSAIFTTYDGSKGLERPICVVFDFDEAYWQLRSSHPDVRYEILRNIFCVAASRGKQKIIFVKDRSKKKLSQKVLCTPFNTKTDLKDKYSISNMFDFKYKEDVEACYQTINCKIIQDSQEIIEINNRDGFIDLSPCIGNYQEQMFFNKYDIDKKIEFQNETRENRKELKLDKMMSIEQKILQVTAFETQQRRYATQVEVPFVTEEQTKKIRDRLSERLSPDDEVQIPCSHTINYIDIVGRADVLHDDVIYELKFTSDLSHEYCLQCASYIACLGYKKGILWNVKDNKMIEITIPDRDVFWKSVYKCITHRT